VPNEEDYREVRLIERVELNGAGEVRSFSRPDLVSFPTLPSSLAELIQPAYYLVLVKTS
jgi:hypothetical protein